MHLRKALRGTFWCPGESGPKRPPVNKVVQRVAAVYVDAGDAVAQGELQRNKARVTSADRHTKIESESVEAPEHAMLFLVLRQPQKRPLTGQTLHIIPSQLVLLCSFPFVCSPHRS